MKIRKRKGLPRNPARGRSFGDLSNPTKAKSLEYSQQSLPTSQETGQFRPLSKQSGRQSLARKILSRVSASLWRGARGLKGIKIHWKF